MSIFSAEHFISIFGTGLLIPLIWIMHRRGQRKAFPCFFIYLLVVLFKSEALLFLKSFYPAAYFYAYWLAEATTILLSFAVIYEIYRKILTSGALPVSRITFFRLNVGMLLLASVISSMMVHTAGYHPLWRTIFVCGSVLRSMQISLFVLVAILSIFYGLYWTGQAFGIALGYGLYALAQLSNTVTRAWVGPAGNQVYVFVTLFAYQCAVLIWLTYALKGEQRVQLEKLPENGIGVWFAPLERLAK